MDLLNRLYFNSAVPPDHGNRKKWDLAAFLYLTAAVFVLEYIQPFYFTQDDNLVQFLPVMLDFCRQLGEGNISTYNPYQLMGFSPVSNGVYALTYPVTHLSWFLANYVFRNENLTLEIFAIIHLFAGYFATANLFRLLKVSPRIAAAGALCFVLSGYSLIAGRSWYYMLPQLFWTPALISCLVLLFDKPNLKRILLGGLVIGISFHSGNAQMWIYSLMFATAATLIVLVSRNLSRASFIAILSALCIGAAIASPLLFLQHTLTENMPGHAVGYGILQGLFSMIFPYPLAENPHPQAWGNLFTQLQGQLYYSATLFSVIGLLSVLVFIFSFFLFKRNKWSTFFNSNVWLFCGVLAFVFALGKYGGLWALFSHVPPFDKFTYPFKFLHFVNFFFVIGGGLLLQRFFSVQTPNRKVPEYIILCSVAALLFYHVTLCKASFYSYGFRPYPELPSGLKNKLENNGRILCMAPGRSAEENYVYSLPHNIASVYSIYSLGGYDAITQSYQSVSTSLDQRINSSTLPDYGIRHVISFKETLPADLVKDMEKVYEEKDITVWEMKQTTPLAFQMGNAAVPLKLQYAQNGFDISISNVTAPADVVVNFCYYPEMLALLDGNLTPIVQDKKGRMQVKIIKQATKLEIRYVPFWRNGLVASGIFLALAGLFFLLFLYISGRTN